MFEIQPKIILELGSHRLIIYVSEVIPHVLLKRKGQLSKIRETILL